MRQVTLSGDIFRKLFTEYNPAFWPVNSIRDVNRSIKLLPNARYFDIAGGGKNSYVKFLFKAIKPAYKSIFKDGTELTTQKTMLRCLISIISFACFGLGYLWILYDKDNLSWSDILTKTKVIKTN